jgi:nickel-type superoxide dismutase maturation protease
MAGRATAGRTSGRRHRIGGRIGIAVVRGDSMEPTLSAGDRLLVSYGARVRPGQVVVARFPDDTLVIKRASERRGPRWWLVGDNPDASTDSRHRGAIAPDDVLGVARLRVWPRPHVL